MVHPYIKKGNLLTKEALLTRKAVAEDQQYHRTRTDSSWEESMCLLTPVCSGLEHKLSGGTFGRIAFST